MSCFVFVVLAEGLGFLSFFGGLFWLVRRVFSGFWGLLCFSFVLLLLVGVGGRVAGGSGVRGLVRPGVLLPFRGGRVGGLLPFRGGRAGGCACARLSVLLPPCWGGGFGWRVLPGSRGGGRVAPGFLFVFAVFLLVFAGGFRVLFFPSGASRVLLVSGVGLRGLAGGWGVVGGVGLGWGCFFSGFCCTGPGLFGFGLGFVWRV